jgi:hypothetical protein
MKTISGLGKESRNCLARVMQETEGTVSVRQVVNIFHFALADCIEGTIRRPGSISASTVCLSSSFLN